MLFEALQITFHKCYIHIKINVKQADNSSLYERKRKNYFPPCEPLSPPLLPESTSSLLMLRSTFFTLLLSEPRR